MARVLSVTFIALLFVIPRVFAGDGNSTKHEVRDPSGKLLYKTTTRGNQTEVRDPSGKLLMKSKTSWDGKTETRSPTGKLLYKSK
jgi:hypothetical protein